MSLYDKQPAISQDVFIAPNASVIGSVSLGEGANIWYGSVLRGTPTPHTIAITFAFSSHAQPVTPLGELNLFRRC
jgi:carbonic anhydrase/acetyltransferase-like protein (isoleucine patch superfamily)